MKYTVPASSSKLLVYAYDMVVTTGTNIAWLAQLVEQYDANVQVASSSLVPRTRITQSQMERQRSAKPYKGFDSL